jgi:dihydroorotase
MDCWENVLYKCGWSPLEAMQSDSFVNGNIVYENGSFSRFLGKEIKV